jgi:outer membrane protein assembly factor BamB
VWRFRAAPEERRITAFGQIESAWPVSGSVLVQDGLAYFCAGLGGKIGGGGHVYAMEPRTGKVVWHRRTAWERPAIMAGDGRDVYLGAWKMAGGTGKPVSVEKSRKRGKGPTYVSQWPFGLLERSWTRHSLALDSHKGFSVMTDGRGGRGHMLALGRTACYGFGVRSAKVGRRKDTPLSAAMFHVFRRPFDGTKDSGKKPAGWSHTVKDQSQVEAIVLAGDRLFLSGPTNRKLREKGFIRVRSITDGQVLAEYPIEAPPAYDGMAAAGGRLYVSLEDGRLICFGNDAG